VRVGHARNTDSLCARLQLREELAGWREELKEAKEKNGETRSQHKKLLAIAKQQEEEVENTDAVIAGIEVGRNAPVGDEVLSLRSHIHETQIAMRDKETAFEAQIMALQITNARLAHQVHELEQYESVAKTHKTSLMQGSVEITQRLQPLAGLHQVNDSLCTEYEKSKQTIQVRRISPRARLQRYPSCVQSVLWHEAAAATALLISHECTPSHIS